MAAMAVVVGSHRKRGPTTAWNQINIEFLVRFCLAGNHSTFLHRRQRTLLSPVRLQDLLPQPQ